MSFLRTFEDNVYSVYRIGGAKAFDGGFLLMGSGHDEVLEYTECPAAVAAAWRDQLARRLLEYRPQKRIEPIDWLGTAAKADEAWARDVGWSPPPATTPQPSRVGPPAPTELKK